MKAVLAVILLIVQFLSIEYTFGNEEDDLNDAIRHALSLEGRFEHLGLRVALDEIVQEDELEQKYQNFTHSNVVNDNREYFIPFKLEHSDWLKASVAAGAAIVFFHNDEDVTKFAQEHQTEVTEKIAYWGERWGAGTEAALLSGAGYVYGVVVKNDKIKSVSKMAIKSMVLSGLVTRAIKTTMRRTRPNKSPDDAHQWFGDLGDHSFPSGHTTLAFSVGTFIAESTKDRSKVIPILAYTASAIAGWSRVHDKAHWASDVVVGAFIGHIVTKNVMNYDRYRRKKSGFVFSPYKNEYGTLIFGFRYVKKQPESLDCQKDSNPIRACLEEAFAK